MTLTTPSAFMVSTAAVTVLYRACGRALAAEQYAQELARRGASSEWLEMACWCAREALQEMRVMVRCHDRLGHAPAGWH